MRTLGVFFVVLSIAVASFAAAPVASAQDVDATGPAVMHAVSCLGGNGRIDTNIVNIGNHSSVYRLEFEGLSAREIMVAEKDWGRIPITGRADDIYTVIVKRDGNVISEELVSVTCDDGLTNVDDDEIRVVNACRAGLGYVLFQFVNDTAADKPYIIEFESVDNRSTTAVAFGASVRAVTGRPDSTYGVVVRTGLTVIESFDVTVSCSEPAPPIGTVVAGGNFIDRAHPTAGGIEVVELASGQRVLRLDEQFVSDDGPDLDIYLSAGTSADGEYRTFATDFVNLGDLISTTGAQEYMIPDGLDLDAYNTVSVWCVAFSVAFGAADLM